jgi:ubiquinone/menaquinone biosynthesis C-methylase UbiE
MQAAAEGLPVADNSFDLVYCVYLFHELPEDVRRKAVKEMARVVKPGGMVILTDSVQLGDRPAYDATLGGFGKFNEPYYENYLATDLGAIFEEYGLECDLKVMSSTTKSLSFKKPLELPAVDESVVEEQEIIKEEEGVVITSESTKEADPMMN